MPLATESTHAPSPTPHEAAEQEALALVARLEGRIASASKAADETRAAYCQASLDEALGVPRASARVEQTRKANQAAREELDQAQATLGGARAHHAEMLKAKKAADEAKHWEETSALKVKLIAASRKLEEQLDDLKPALGDVQRLGLALFDAAPVVGKSLAHSGLRPESLQAFVRVQLRRNGFKWAKSIFTDEEKLPTLSQLVAEEVALLEKFKPRTQGSSS